MCRAGGGDLCLCLLHLSSVIWNVRDISAVIGWHIYCKVFRTCHEARCATGQGNEGPRLSLVVSFLCGYPEDEEASHDVATLWGQVPILDPLSLVRLPQRCGRWHLSQASPGTMASPRCSLWHRPEQPLLASALLWGLLTSLCSQVHLIRGSCFYPGGSLGWARPCPVPAILRLVIEKTS